MPKFKIHEHDLYGSNFSIESMKVIAESIGMGYLADDAAKELAEDISYKIKHIIQDAAKFMHQAKRTKLVASDVDASLKTKNIEVSRRTNFYELTYNFLIFSLSMVSNLQNQFHSDLPLVVVENYIS